MAERSFKRTFTIPEYFPHAYQMDDGWWVNANKSRIGFEGSTIRSEIIFNDTVATQALFYIVDSNGITESNVFEDNLEGVMDLWNRTNVID